MAFRKQVAYLDDCIPQYLEINADEFHRVIRLIGSALPDLASAGDSVEWVSTAKGLYTARLHEAERLAGDLRGAFAVAAPALDEYGSSLARAKAKLEEGDRAADALGQLIAPIALFQTPVFRDSEPLAQWEDLRTMTSPRDFFAEVKWREQIDAIRPRAEALYLEAAHAYDSAGSIERDAREECISVLHAAFRKLPDFKADSEAAETIIEKTPGLAAEMLEAESLDDNVRLPGQGPVPRFGVDATDLSEAHQDLRDRAGNIKLNGPTWGTGEFVDWYVGGDKKAEHEFKLKWIRAYGPVIQAAAAENGIPAEVLAGIVYIEVGGKPMWMDDAADWARKKKLWPGRPDDTSYGPLAVQVDTAAKALGYDPDALTDKQRQEIVASLKDPKQNIMITAKVLRDEKHSTDFPYTEARDMTREQGRQLAARYNAGPNWDGGDGQRYADDFSAHVDEAGRALR